MKSVSVREVQTELPKLLALLSPGEELVITDNGEPVGKLVGPPATDRPPRELGTMKGSVLYIAPDFDSPLDEFKEYME